MTAIAFTTPASTRGAVLLQKLQQPSRILWIAMTVFAAGALVCLGLQLIDDRMFNGANVWIKPAKFYSSLAMQFATVAWAMQFLPRAELESRRIKVPIIAFTAAAVFELVYITWRAARAEASHFNIATPFDAALYALMGFGAVTLTVVSAHIGWRIWRHRHDNLWAEAAALGLIMGAILSTLTGMYLGQQTGHSVGGDPTDATGTGFFGWSTTGGDLRVAHFVGLHASQFIPLAALTGRRATVWGVAFACVFLTAGTFVMALSGTPLLRN